MSDIAQSLSFERVFGLMIDACESDQDKYIVHRIWKPLTKAILASARKDSGITDD